MRAVVKVHGMDNLSVVDTAEPALLPWFLETVTSIVPEGHAQKIVKKHGPVEKSCACLPLSVV